MVVKEVRRRGNNVFVSFNENKELIIPYDVFLKNYLSVEDEISDKEIKDIELKVEIYKIKQSSFRYLSGRNHSRYELQVKLMKKKYQKDLIQDVLNDLERQQLLSDSEFAKSYFSAQQRRKRGLLKIKSDLYKKGVSREIIEETLSGHQDDEIFIESAMIMAQKKYNVLVKREIKKSKINQKIFQFLASRGFTSNIIIESIKKIELENREN